MRPIRLLLLNEHCIIREGIKTLLEQEDGLEIVAEAGSGWQALQLVNALNPDVVLLDVQLTDMSGDELCRQLALRHPHIHAIILTASPNDEKVLQCIQAGAEAYVFKNSDVADLIDTIKRVCRGNGLEKANMAGAWTGCRADEAPCQQEKCLSHLTSQEITIIKLVSAGLTNKEIAQRLFLSPNTVKYHISNIMRKLDVKRRAEIAFKASRDNLV